MESLENKDGIIKDIVKTSIFKFKNFTIIYHITYNLVEENL